MLWIERKASVLVFPFLYSSGFLADIRFYIEAMD
ncbi:hypothetical protein APH_0710 [Anaplasma phagocytophilum str. HZ]|uniref:Uncharacterized protein n=1 Tax=Anaplasma phagocytophilum (strain HZ) TaxID=212042 RepID=Q2GK10_ANAPZ|nr:hypothetical protein APH_0710 [Anaplasma phagocytophilum str. HZ]